jgi:hypothetical protein
MMFERIVDILGVVVMIGGGILMIASLFGCGTQGGREMVPHEVRVGTDDVRIEQRPIDVHFVLVTKDDNSGQEDWDEWWMESMIHIANTIVQERLFRLGGFTTVADDTLYTANQGIVHWRLQPLAIQGEVTVIISGPSETSHGQASERRSASPYLVMETASDQVTQAHIFLHELMHCAGLGHEARPRKGTGQLTTEDYVYPHGQEYLAEFLQEVMAHGG